MLRRLTALAPLLLSACFFQVDPATIDGGFQASGALGSWSLAPAACKWTKDDQASVSLDMPDDSVAPRVRLTSEFTGTSTVDCVGPAGEDVVFEKTDCATFDVDVELSDASSDDSSAKGHAYLGCSKAGASLMGHIDFDKCQASR